MVYTLYLRSNISLGTEIQWLNQHFGSIVLVVIGDSRCRRHSDEGFISNNATRLFFVTIGNHFISLVTHLKCARENKGRRSKSRPLEEVRIQHYPGGLKQTPFFIELHFAVRPTRKSFRLFSLLQQQECVPIIVAYSTRIAGYLRHIGV